MVFKHKLVEFNIKTKVKDQWSNHYILVELQDGKVWLFNTTDIKFKKMFESITDYSSFAYLNLQIPSLILYTEITHTKEGKQILDR
jgi:hypothetical protein